MIKFNDIWTILFPDQFHWGPDSVKLLLELRLSKNYLWLNPNAKKIELWENVSKNMKKNHFNVEGHACDMKYRNLLKTYKANKDKFEKGVLSYHHWPYYEMFDSHLNHDPSASDTHDGEANEEQVGDGKRGLCLLFQFLFLFFFQAKSKKEKISNSYITHFTLSIFCLLSCRYLSKFCNLLGYLVMFGFFSYVYFLYHFWIPSCFVQEFTLAQIPFFLKKSTFWLIGRIHKKKTIF